MNKEEKQKQAEAIHQTLEKAHCVVLSGFEGSTVGQDADLRRKIAGAGARYKVVKNSLIERAAQGTMVEPAAKKLRGTTSLAFTETDPVALAKALTAYAKENPALVFKAGGVEGRGISLAEFVSLASLPSREALLSKGLFLINSPAPRLAAAGSPVAPDFGLTLHQAVQEKQFNEPAGGQ